MHEFVDDDRVCTSWTSWSDDLPDRPHSRLADRYVTSGQDVAPHDDLFRCPGRGGPPLATSTTPRPPVCRRGRSAFSDGRLDTRTGPGQAPLARPAHTGGCVHLSPDRGDRRSGDRAGDLSLQL